MFILALIIGIYSYLIFFLGLLGLLYKNSIMIVTFLYFALVILLQRKFLAKMFLDIKAYVSNLSQFSRPYHLCLALIITQLIINFIGAIGPELGFDALWYHLTLPKIYLQNHKIFFIRGGLLYYSAMPKLTEMLYLSALAINGEILAKLIHFSFGILTLIALYQLSRKFLSPTFSLAAVLIFYTNLVVGWMSTTSYIDLARTFFELVALREFVNFVKTNRRLSLIKTSISLGFAVTTKLLSLGSVLIFSLLLILATKKSLKKNAVVYFAFLFLTLLIPLPWFIFSLINTGNPFYPFLNKIYPVEVSSSLINPFLFLKDLWLIFTRSADPLSPVYLIILPLIFIYFKNFKRELRLISLYSLLAIFVWYLTPRTGGGRFILPYLPAFSILASGTANCSKEKFIKQLLMLFIITSAIVSIIYRGAANRKYLPVILGKQTKDNFLSKNLNFSFGDFYDVDGYFKKHIKPTDKVLIYDIHNLYYVDFPFVHYSYLKPEDEFNYFLTQKNSLPKEFANWKLVYESKKTKVRLYSQDIEILRY